jgi:hypothetical protein
VGENLRSVYTSMFKNTKIQDIAGGVIIPAPVVLADFTLQHTPQGNFTITEIIMHLSLLIALLETQVTHLGCIIFIYFTNNKVTLLLKTLMALLAIDCFFPRTEPLPFEPRTSKGILWLFKICVR